MLLWLHRHWFCTAWQTEWVSCTVSLEALVTVWVSSGPWCKMNHILVLNTHPKKGIKRSTQSPMGQPPDFPNSWRLRKELTAPRRLFSVYDKVGLSVISLCLICNFAVRAPSTKDCWMLLRHGIWPVCRYSCKMYFCHIVDICRQINPRQIGVSLMKAKHICQRGSAFHNLESLLKR